MIANTDYVALTSYVQTTYLVTTLITYFGQEKTDRWFPYSPILWSKVQGNF